MMIAERQLIKMKNNTLRLLFLFNLLLPKLAYSYSDVFTSRSQFFQAYKPIYFIVGKDAKINLSFKSQILGTTPIYFAYSQLMDWQVFNESPYFSDINYNPEVFYRITLNALEQQTLDLGLIEHESNGLGGAQEKSWNRSTLKLQWVSNLNENEKIYWNLKFWVAYQYTKYNPDIVNYRGIGELVVTFTQFISEKWDQDDLTLRIFLGGSSHLNPLQGGQELTLRVKAKDRSFLPLFVAQLYHGYGETMNTFSQDTMGLRLGFGF